MASKQRRKTENHAAMVANLSARLKLAEQGNLQAQHDLAAFYATADLAGLKGEVAAVTWYKRAAESGHAESQYDLGFMLLLGEGVGRDVAEGMRWLEQAGGSGSTSAAILLADIYDQGLFEVAINREKAEYWGQLSGASGGRI